MADMPRPRPPHLQRETTRHGNAVWYVRVGKGPRIRIRAEYGTPAFDLAYVTAVNEGTPVEAHGSRPKAAKGSLQWLYDRYRETTAWADLSTATRRQRENILKHVMAASGHEPYTAIRKAHVVAGRDRRARTPAQSRNFLDAMRGLFRWAREADHVKVDPTDGVKNPKRPKNAGFAAWTEADVAAYQKRWPLGTRQRVWLDVLLYTGPRRGDAVKLGKQHVRKVTQMRPDASGAPVPVEIRMLQFKTEKSGEEIEVTIPVLDVLQRTLDAGPVGDLAWIVGATGQPFVKESFGNKFSEAARAAGVRKSAHGVRKIAATTAANNGATVAELEAIFGWHGGRMASLYTRTADRARLAQSGAAKLDGNRTSPPAPAQEVRATGRKAK